MGNKFVIQRGEKAIKALRALSQPLNWRIIQHLGENKNLYPSKIAKDLKISPATAGRKLQELADLNLVLAHWKIEAEDGIERPIKIYEAVPAMLRYEIIVGSPKGLEVLTNMIKSADKILVEWRGDELADASTKTKRLIYCSLEGEPIRLEGKKAMLASELSRKNKLKLSDLMKKKEFKNATELKALLTDLLTKGLITINEQ
ncbi:helix-turn-helix transcriptional regulator [Candidatus Woesearchaeota archaeon]|nr:helix-turn-helix transcriptional regulator [Candidatus Woesearchaeota archaeon]